MEASEIAIFAFVIISSLTFHEAAHAIAATACGDDLAKSQGRVTLNPLSHIDLFGTIILPLILFMVAGFGFGYAKPVPFRPENFRRPRLDTVLVAMAGPAANVVLAVVFLVIGVALVQFSGGPAQVPELVLVFFLSAIMINCILFVFNMIPLPPLDGHYILDLFLSERARMVVRQLGIFGILIAWYLSRPLFDLVLPPIQGFVLRAFGAA